MEKTQIDFFNNNKDLKWFPILLVKKTPIEIRHDCYFRYKKDGTPTYIPNFTEFTSINEKQLLQRQEYFGGQLPYNAIDTYKIAQIDIDTPNINQDWLNALLNSTPYYKSLTKEYGYHIFVKLNDFNADKITYHFKTVFDEDDAFEKCSISPDKGKVELLTGKWGYIHSNTKIHNAEKPIIELSNISQFLVDYSTFSKVRKTEKVPKTVPKDVGIYPHHIRQEIHEHMINISQEYIDDYNHHIKIVNAILRTGYEDIAYDCMMRSSNSSNKNLDNEFDKFKNSNLYDITDKTLFYYSKLSNEKQFLKIIRKYQYHQLREQGRRFFFNLNGITETINERYLPKNLITKYLKKDERTIIHIQSPMGTGKTTMVKHYLNKNRNAKVLYISPRRTFSNDVFSDLQSCGFQHYQFIDTYKKFNNNEIPPRIICQVESLHKIKNQSYEIVIIDEIESDLTQLISTTNKVFFNTHVLFDRFIKDAKKVICMDAFLSKNSQDTINNIKPHTNTITIKNEYKTKNNWTAVEIDKYKELRTQAICDLELGKRIVFVSSVKKVARDFMSYIPKKYTSKLYTGDSSDKDKRFDDVETEWTKLDVLVYTGVITCGVSFDPPNPHFDAIYCYLSPSGSSARDIHQSLQRVRQFKEKNLYFCVDKSNYVFNKDFISNDINEITHNTHELIKIKECHGINKLPEWAINNYVFNEYTKNINYIFQLPLFCEYLRVQGYKIIYCDYADGIRWDAHVNFLGGDRYSPSKMTWQDYEHLQTRCYDLTTDEKHKIKCYEFERRFDWFEKKIFLTILYKHFNTEKGINVFNVMFKPDVYYEDMENISDNEKTVLNTSVEQRQYEKINELVNILKCRKIYELNYDTFLLNKNQDKLLKWISEVEPYFNFRKTQGDEPVKYINSVIKYISETWCGLRVGGKKSSKMINGDKKNYYTYTNTTNGKDLYLLYKLFIEIEKNL